MFSRQVNLLGEQGACKSRIAPTDGGVGGGVGGSEQRSPLRVRGMVRIPIPA